MSDQDEDLELAALQRQLDDAFETTRPRAGFEDELWTRMQAGRPAGSKLRDAWLGFLQGIRAVPAVPTAAVAAVLVVIVGAGIVVMSGLGRTYTSSATSAPGGRYVSGADTAKTPGAFGRLPTPALNKPSGAPAATAPQPSTSAGATYSGPVTLTWTGKLELNVPSALVFRYHEPSTTTADQFASSLGAIAQARPAGHLGSYNTTDFNLRVRGTLQSPAREPWFELFPISTLPAIEAAGGPADVAVVFLAEHSLVPSWPYTPAVLTTGDQSKVTLLRQVDVSGYGKAFFIDSSGERYGLEVTLKGNTALTAAGPLPLNLESASYPIISGDDAVRSALASSPPGAGGASAPTVALTEAELVYVLVVAGDHSFYEPAFLFSGKFTAEGRTYARRVLVPAVDPSLRTA